VSNIDLNQQIANLIKDHIDNVDDAYQAELNKPHLSAESRSIITNSINREITELAMSISYLEKSRVITLRQSLSCMVALAEVKSNFLKITA